MKAIREIALTLAGATVALSAVADDKEEMFNPIVTSVIFFCIQFRFSDA